MLSKIIENNEKLNFSMLIKPIHPYLLIRLVTTDKNKKLLFVDRYLSTLEATDANLKEVIEFLQNELSNKINKNE